MYITIGRNGKRYYPDEWQFVAYQFLNIHLDDKERVGKPYCIKLHNGIEEILELSNIDKYGNTLNYWQLPYDDYIKPTAGEVYIGYEKKDGNKVREKIVILPSVLQADEFEQMAIQIANIVFNCQSFTLANFSQQTQQGIGENRGQHIGATVESQPLGQFDQLLTKLPKFLDVLDKNLEIIEKTPALTMRAVKQQASIIKSNKPKDLLTRKIQPTKKTTLSYEKVYDDNSPENRWLGYLVYKTLPNLVDSFLTNFQDYQKISALEQVDKDRLAGHDETITEIKKKLALIQKGNFISKFKSVSRVPPITTRLVKSKGYATILRNFQEVFKDDLLIAFQQYQETVTAYTSGYVDNLSNIYEHWCLVVLYHNLLKIGFKPETEKDRLESAIELKDNNLVIPSQSVFRLSKPFAQYDNKIANSQKKITISLYYEAKLFFDEQKMLADSSAYYDYLTPDIFMEIEAPERAYGLERFSVILDAKFKNYDGLNLSYWLARIHELKDIKYFQDVMHTAMYKYHYRLTNFYIKNIDVKKSQVGLSAILHPNKGFLWQGEKPLEDCEFLKVDKSEISKLFGDFSYLNSITYKSFVAHKFGSLILRPNSIAKDIRRLFAIIFHYHMGLTSLCLQCGRELYLENEFKINNDDNTSFDNKMTKYREMILQTQGVLDGFIDYKWADGNPTTKFHAKCINCHTEWRVSFCASKKGHSNQPDIINNNRIIKVGIDNKNNIGHLAIHNITEEGTYCPKCGNFKQKYLSNLNYMTFNAPYSLADYVQTNDTFF